MILTNLDGFAANVSVTTQLYSGGSLTGTPLEHNVWANAVSLSAEQDVAYTPKITFGSSPGAKTKSVMERDIKGALSGLLPKGAGSTGPLSLVNGQKFNMSVVVDDPTPLSAGTDVCSYAFDAIANSARFDLVAKANFARGMAFESTGAWVEAWVTA